MVNLKPETKARVEALAEVDGRSASNYVERILLRALGELQVEESGANYGGPNAADTLKSIVAADEKAARPNGDKVGESAAVNRHLRAVAKPRKAPR